MPTEYQKKGDQNHL